MENAVSTKPEMISVAPQFTVADVVATATYYADVLGFSVSGYFGDPPVFAIVHRGPVEIFFNHAPDVAGKPRLRAAVGYDAYIHVSGMDDLVAELRSRNAKIIEGPVDRVYKMVKL